MRQHVTRAGIAVIAVAGLLVAGAPASQAVYTFTLPESVKAEYREVFEDRDIPVELWDSLIDKVSSGQLLDADNPDVDPISTEPTVFEGESLIRNTFADGSIAFTSIPLEETPVPAATDTGLITPFGTQVKSCTSRTSNGYTYRENCRVVYDGISFSYSFRADFRTKSGTNANISKVHSPIVHRAIGHAVSDRKVERIRVTQSGNNAAHARMSFDMQAAYVLWSRTIVLDLYVRGTSYWTSTNL